MNTRTYLTLLWALAGLVLLAVLAWTAVQFALPRPEWVELGALADYPPSEEPYFIQGQTVVYITNDGHEVIVLDPLNYVQGGAVVHWNTRDQDFIDPSRGSHFDLYGQPTRNLAGTSIVEEQGLRRYQIKIENGLIFMDSKNSRIFSFNQP